ncbi:hypothetical protein BsWGS_16302 [Bradybaena similaris]
MIFFPYCFLTQPKHDVWQHTPPFNLISRSSDGTPHCFSIEAFIQACVTFLKRRCPQLLGLPKKKASPQMQSQQLSPETVATMLN